MTVATLWSEVCENQKGGVDHLTGLLKGITESMQIKLTQDDPSMTKHIFLVTHRLVTKCKFSLSHASFGYWGLDAFPPAHIHPHT